MPSSENMGDVTMHAYGCLCWGGIRSAPSQFTDLLPYSARDFLVLLSSTNHLRKSLLPGKDAASKKMSCIDSIQFALVSKFCSLYLAIL